MTAQPPDIPAPERRNLTGEAWPTARGKAIARRRRRQRPDLQRPDTKKKRGMTA